MPFGGTRAVLSQPPNYGGSLRAELRLQLYPTLCVSSRLKSTPLCAKQFLRIQANFDQPKTMRCLTPLSCGMTRIPAPRHRKTNDETDWPSRGAGSISGQVDGWHWERIGVSRMARAAWRSAIRVPACR